MNKTLVGNNRRIIETEEWIKDLIDKMMEITPAKQKREKRVKRNEHSLNDLWLSSIHIFVVPVGEKREKDSRKYLKK